MLNTKTHSQVIKDNAARCQISCHSEPPTPPTFLLMVMQRTYIHSQVVKEVPVIEKKIGLLF